MDDKGISRRGLRHNLLNLLAGVNIWTNGYRGVKIGKLGQ
jgi:hypothetical protein